MKILILIAIVLLFTLASITQVCAEESEYNPITIISPSQNSMLNADGTVLLKWTNEMGDVFTYTVLFSANGVVYDKVVAEKLDKCEYIWKPDAIITNNASIKIKVFDQNGMPLYEKSTKVSLTLDNAIYVSKAEQKVFVFSQGKIKYTFTCSTALPEYDLKEGYYKVYAREEKHWSKKYKVWMPNALFFFEGYALHATTMVRQLGRAASHGCVRLSPKDALTLYNEIPIGTPVIVLPKTEVFSPKSQG